MKYYLGIDLGGTKIAFGVANENKEILAKHSIPTNSSRPYSVIIEDIANTCLSFLSDNKISMDDVEGVGIGAPGAIDYKANILIASHNLGWHDADVANDLKKLLNKNVYMANDADAATFGELLNGAGKDQQSMAMLTLGTGVGGGVIIDGKIFGGGDGNGLELGHVTLVANGDDCVCGNKGCVETYVSTSALIKYARENTTKSSKMYALCSGDLDKIDGKIIFESAKENDPDALKTLETFRGYLAVTCYSTIMSYRPDSLVIGGGISVQEELLIEPIREKVRDMLKPIGSISKTPIICAKLGNDAGILGACFLCDIL